MKGAGRSVPRWMGPPRCSGPPVVSPSPRSSRGRREERSIRCVRPYVLQHIGRNLPPFHLQVRTLLCIALAFTLLAGCGDGGNPKSTALTKRQADSALAGAPAALASLHSQANELLGGGRTAFEHR